jgi:hypothetical protein
MFKDITKDIYTKIETTYPVPPAMNHIFKDGKKEMKYTTNMKDFKQDKIIIVQKNAGILKKL